MHLQEIVNRIDQRLESLGISALEAERRAGRRDAIRNMRRAVARGKGGVTMRTIDALAPALGIIKILYRMIQIVIAETKIYLDFLPLTALQLIGCSNAHEGRSNVGLRG